MTTNNQKRVASLLMVRSNRGESASVMFGSRNRRALCSNYDDDDYDCGCCIGGFSK